MAEIFLVAPDELLLWNLDRNEKNIGLENSYSMKNIFYKKMKIERNDNKVRYSNLKVDEKETLIVKVTALKDLLH